MTNGILKSKYKKTLTASQYAIFALLGHGFTTRAIAKSREIKTKTVSAHIYNIMLRLRCDSATKVRKLAARYMDPSNK